MLFGTVAVLGAAAAGRARRRHRRDRRRRSSSRAALEAVVAPGRRAGSRTAAAASRRRWSASPAAAVAMRCCRGRSRPGCSASLIIARRAGDRDPVDAGDGDAQRRRRGARHRAGLRVRARQPRVGVSAQALGDAGSARLADATGDHVPYLILAALRASRSPAWSASWLAVRRARPLASRRLMAAGDHRRQGDRAGRSAPRSRADVAAWVAAGHAAPGLATVLVGDDPASAVYVGGKQKASRRGRHRRASTTGSPHGRGARRGRAAAARAQRRPARVRASCSSCRRRRRSTARALTELIDPAKDVDGLTPISAGPAGQGPPGPAAVHAARA